MGGARRPRKGLAGGGRVRSAAGRSDRDCRFAQQRPALGIFRRSCDSPTPGSRSTGRTHRRAARRRDEQIACQVAQVRRSVSGGAPDRIFRRDRHRVRGGPGWCAAAGDARPWCTNRRLRPGGTAVTGRGHARLRVGRGALSPTVARTVQASAQEVQCPCRMVCRPGTGTGMSPSTDRFVDETVRISGAMEHPSQSVHYGWFKRRWRGLTVVGGQHLGIREC